MSYPHLISVAPMMDYTDRHCRYFLRQITRCALLYTEMITSHALVHGDASRLLAYHPDEHPVALQLGGNDPKDLAYCAKLGQDFGYHEINLNVGCPSDRVSAGAFGLSLMKNPALVARCIRAMQKAVSVPITVKTRIGVDDYDDDAYLNSFIRQIADTGCKVFILHARKGWLRGLSPKENRTIPPLNYQRVYQLKQDFPELTIIINGGIETLQQSTQHLAQVDGVMLGRAAYHNPYLLHSVDQLFYAQTEVVPTRQEIVERMFPYIEQHLAIGGKLHSITRHMLGLMQGEPGAKNWRRNLSTQINRPCLDFKSLLNTLV